MKLSPPLTPAAYINSLPVRMATDAEVQRQYGHVAAGVAEAVGYGEA